MANTFSSSFSRSKKTFNAISEPMNAGEYIYNKKAKQIYYCSKKCFYNNCYQKCLNNKNLFSESDLLLFKKVKFGYSNNFNKQQLSNNLITKLNLEGLSVISTNNISPTDIPTVSTADGVYYNVDPSGNLFGNTICGTNNFVNYMQYYNVFTNNINI